MTHVCASYSVHLATGAQSPANRSRSIGDEPRAPKSWRTAWGMTAISALIPRQGRQKHNSLKEKPTFWKIVPILDFIHANLSQSKALEKKYFFNASILMLYGPKFPCGRSRRSTLKTYPSTVSIPNMLDILFTTLEKNKEFSIAF